MASLKQLRETVSAHRRPAAVVGAVAFALLLSAGVSLANHSHFSLLPNAQSVATHTTTRTVTVDQSIPFQLRQEADSTLSSGDQFVRSQGEMGMREVTFRVTYLNGQEIRRTLVSSTVVRQPSARIVLVGAGSTADVTSNATSSQTSVNQNNSNVSVNSTGNCTVKTSGDIGSRSITSNNGSYHFSSTNSNGSSNNSISVNCTGD